MVDIVFHVSPTTVDDTTCLCENPANLRAETKLGAYSRELVPDGAGTNSAAWALISVPASCLLATLLTLLLKATLHVITNWNGRFLRLFLKVTLLRPNTVDRTCPGHDRGSSAGTRQGDTTSASASVQLALTSPVAAGHRRNIGGKRRGDDGSDAEDNDRPKRMRLVNQKATQPSFLCPFRAYDPDNPRYLKCGKYHKWCHLREHLLDRTHKPRDRCPICGEIFTDDVEWDLHTSVPTCEMSPRAWERPFWVERHQAASIRDLSKRGSKTEPMEEMCRKVYLILFGSESGPDRNALAHPTWFPQFQHMDDNLGVDHSQQEPWDTLKRTTANLLGMQTVPGDDSMQQVIDCIVSYLGHPREQAHAVPSHELGAGDAAADEQLENKEAIIEDWMPPATPKEGQVPRISEPHRYASGGSEGQLEHSLSGLSTYLSKDVGNPSPLVSTNTAHVSSIGLKPDKLDCDSGYVNPILLQRQDAHHIHVPVPNDTSTPTAFPSGSATSQASEATVPRSSWGQLLGDAGCSNSGETPDSLDDFDFSVKGFSRDVDSTQLSDGGAPQQQPETRDVPGCFQ